MKRKFKQDSQEQVSSKDALKAQFEEVRSKKVEKADTRVVNVMVRVGCGCGGSYEKYNVEVPMNSSVKNGQYFSDFEDDWRNVKEGWV